MHRGYIKMYRKISDGGLLQIPNTYALFSFILLNAAHKSITVGTTSGVIQLEAGQFISGRLALAQALRQSEREVRTSLDRLVKMEILTIKSTSKYSVYSIVNYSNYQGCDQQNDQQNDQQTTSKRPTNDQQTTTKQELKHLNTKALKEEKIKTIPASLLASLGVDEKIAADWITLRKQKKAAITETAVNGILLEAEKAGYSLETALRVCCERGWAGFKAEWVLNGGAAKKTPAPDNFESINYGKGVQDL